jgi:hypothetical protein
LLDRVPWNRSVRNKKYLKISSPIRLHLEDEVNDQNISREEESTEKGDEYLHSDSTAFERPALKVELVELHGQYTVRDVSQTSRWKRSPGKSNPTADPIDMPLDTSTSPRGRSRYPGVTKIPEDLPCHQCYLPLSRSRSARILESQKTWSPSLSQTEEPPVAEGIGPEWSDSSSVYSQDSADCDITIHIEQLE